MPSSFWRELHGRFSGASGARGEGGGSGSIRLDGRAGLPHHAYMALPPGPSLPAAAQTAAFMLRPTEFLEQCHRRYGDSFTIDTLLFGAEVNVVHPDAVRQLFTGDPEVLRAGEANEALEPLLGSRSVLLLDGAAHVQQRRLLLPPFHGERMLAYARTMVAISEEAVGRLPVGRPFAVHPYVQRITLDIILRTVFGVDEGEDLDVLRAALTRLLDRLASSPLASLALAPGFRIGFLGLTPWDGFLRDRRFADTLIYRQIARRRAALKGQATGTSAQDDILAMLLEARDEEGRPMTDLELRDELVTLLVAGHETTATMLCWAFDLILADERVEGRLLAEIDAGSDPTKSEYLDATIKEVLRLRPVIPAVGRKLSAPMEVGGHLLPGWHARGPLDVPRPPPPCVYPDPEAFRPERFLGTKPDPYAWLPFGGGARRCLGMAFALYELKLVLATVLAGVRVRKARPEPARIALRAFTLVPGSGAELVVEARRTRRPAGAQAAAARAA